MSRRALLLVNPHAHQAQKCVLEAAKELRALSLELIEEPTANPQQLPDVIRRYQHQVDLVVIGGGDGTLNAAVEGLVDTQLPLGILPMGTANDLARTLGIPINLTTACQIIAKGQIRRIDLGWVNEKHFFNVASLGLSVQITRQLSKEVKRRWGVWAYAITALRVFWQAQPFRAEIHLENELVLAKTIQIAVGNGRYYGGGMTIADDAAIDDRRLDMYSLDMQHWWQILALLPALRQGEHSTWPGVHSFNGQEIEIYTHRPRAINTDGEITTYTPAKFRVIPAAIAVCVPDQRDGE